MAVYKTMITFLICIVIFNTAAALDSNPPGHGSGLVSGTVEFNREAVTAVVVKSWNGIPGMLIWEQLNDDWSLYGDTEIIIDYLTLIEADNLSLADLEGVGADVVIVSDPSGTQLQWQQSEVDALEAYANQGHNLVGTFLLYQYEQFDNRALAPLWGHRPDLEYITDDADDTMALGDPGHCLFTNIGDPMNFGGYMYVMIPDDGSWDVDDMAGAYLAGRSDTGRNAVTVYEASSYNAYYISNMPEYDETQTQDAQQWLYNAIICNVGPVSTVHSTWSEVKAIYR